MSFIWDVQLPSMWVSQAAPAGTKGFRAFGEQQQPQLHMGDVQVDLLLVSQLSHGGMLRTLLASAALCWDMVPGQALWFLQGCHLPWDPLPYLCLLSTRLEDTLAICLHCLQREINKFSRSHHPFYSSSN